MAVRLVCFVTLLACAGPAAAQPADSLGEAYYLFLQGRMDEGRDDLPAAISKYERALEVLPEAAGIRAELAALYARRGQVADARAEAERALVTEPGNVQAHRLLGLLTASAIERLPSRGENGQLAAAITHLERALAGNPADLTVQLTLSDLYVRDRQYAKAIDLLRRFLLERPGYTRAVDLLAEAYRENGQPDEAARLIEDFRRERPGSIEARLRDVRLLEQSGQWREAAILWGRIVADEGGAGYRARQAVALANSGDLDGSREVLVELTRENPGDPTGWYLLSQIEVRSENFAAAEAAAARIGEIDSSDPRGPLALARARAAAGNDRGVVEALDARVQAATPEEIENGVFAEMVGQLAGAFTRLDEGPRAIEVLERARERAPQSEDILFALAAGYEQNRDFGRAERAFRELIAANPSHAHALNYLGYMLADRGQALEEALTLITRALAIDEDNPAYLDSLGWAYFKLNRFEDARDPLERAAAAMPRASVVQDHLGDLYLQLQRYPEALMAFEKALAGDREGVDIDVVTGKRDRARALSRQ